MTNYNERLDEVLCKLTTGYTREELLSLPEEDTGLDEFEVKEELDAVDDAKQAITSLIKELALEARIDELKAVPNHTAVNLRVRNRITQLNKQKEQS